MSILVAFGILPDQLQSMFIGVFKALGKQSIANKINFVGYWLLTVFSSYYFTFMLRPAIVNSNNDINYV